MRNLKAIDATERVELFTTLFDNPEITAMAAIAEILRELPDDAARLRVMRWSFGRYGEEFKRPLVDPMPETVVAASPAPAPALTLVERPAAAMSNETPAPADQDVDVEPETLDFAREISDLKDLFGRRPRALVSSPA